MCGTINNYPSSVLVSCIKAVHMEALQFSDCKKNFLCCSGRRGFQTKHETLIYATCDVPLPTWILINASEFLKYSVFFFLFFPPCFFMFGTVPEIYHVSCFSQKYWMMKGGKTWRNENQMKQYCLWCEIKFNFSTTILILLVHVVCY